MRLLLVAIFLSVALAGCVTQTNSAKPSASNDGPVALKPGDAPALVGTWDGLYVLEGGFQGQTTLKIVDAVPGSVQAYFEFRWEGGGRDRYPSGEEIITGYIAEHGELRLGGWVLWLSRKGDTYTFNAEGQVGGKPGELWWWRSDVTGLGGS